MEAIARRQPAAQVIIDGATRLDRPARAPRVSCPEYRRRGNDLTLPDGQDLLEADELARVLDPDESPRRVDKGASPHGDVPVASGVDRARCGGQSAGPQDGVRAQVREQIAGGVGEAPIDGLAQASLGLFHTARKPSTIPAEDLG